MSASNGASTLKFDKFKDIDDNIIFQPLYVPEDNSFFFKMEITTSDISNNIDHFLHILDKEMNPWEKNFFITPGRDHSFTFCPGLNIEHILFSNELNSIDVEQLDLYTLQWLFSVAMGIHTLHSKNIDYLGLTDQSVFIDAKLGARLSNFGSVVNKNASTVLKKIAFYSPEQFEYYQKGKELSQQQKKMSDIYSYGIFSHELLTRLNHFHTYFNHGKFENYGKIAKGAITYMNFDWNLPFSDLLYHCLDINPMKRWKIENVIEYLLNVEHKKQLDVTNSQYFNINNVDIEKYHEFIINILGFDEKTSYKTAKEQILNMIYKESPLGTNPKDTINKCTFDDLREGYKKGILYCLDIIEQCLSMLSNEHKNQYNKFIKKNPQINKFDVMGTFIKYRELPDGKNTLNKELQKLQKRGSNENNDIMLDEILSVDTKFVFCHYYNTKYNTFFTKMEISEEIDTEFIDNFFKNVNEMDRWKKNFFVTPYGFNLDQAFILCPGENINSFIINSNNHKIEKCNLDCYILKWIFSIAMGIFILHSNDINDFELSDRSVFIDSNMNARLINLNYPPDTELSVVPDKYYFYSPEKFYITAVDKSQKKSNITPPKLEKEDKELSDVFSFGSLTYELITKNDQSFTFKSKKNADVYNIFKSGLDKFYGLDKQPDFPLCELLLHCFKGNPKDRWKINQIVDYLVKLGTPDSNENIKSNNNQDNQKYLNLSNIDFEEYHQFILNSLGIDPKTDYTQARNLIFDMLSGKNKFKFRSFSKIKNKCTLAELKKGSALGITNCDEILNKMVVVLGSDLFEKFRKVTENFQTYKFDIMMIFVEYRDDEQLLDKNLDDFLNKIPGPGQFDYYLYNMDNDQSTFKKYKLPDYIKLPYHLKYEFHQIPNYDNGHVVQPLLPYTDRIQDYKLLNLYNYLYESELSQKEIPIQIKLKILHSVAEGLKEIHSHGFFMSTFSSKNVYIDKDFKAYLFVPKADRKPTKDYINFFRKLKESIFNEEDEVISNDFLLFYCPPEIYNNDIQKVDYDKIDVFSLGVLAKELIEHNLPSLYTSNLSNSGKLKLLKNPHWRDFSSSSFTLGNNRSKSAVTPEFIKVLNSCLKKNPEERVKIEQLCECFSKLNLNDTNFNIPRSIVTNPRDNDNHVKSNSTFKYSSYRPKLPIDASKNIEANYSIDSSFLSLQFSEINSRVNRLANKKFTKNTVIGGISPQTARQIALREIFNNKNHLELSFMINNNVGCPNEKPLTMNFVEDTVYDMKKVKIFDGPIKKNNRGDMVIELPNIQEC